MLRTVLFACLVAMVGCDGGYPRDPERTALLVAQRRLVRAGITDNPPWVTLEHGEARGPEAELVTRFAQRLGARVVWRAGQQEALLSALQRFELDLVVGGLNENTAFSKRVGLTRPWFVVSDEQALVVAVPPGENAWLGELERFLAREKPALARLVEEATP